MNYFYITRLITLPLTTEVKLIENQRLVRSGLLKKKREKTVPISNLNPVNKNTVDIGIRVSAEPLKICVF